MKYLYVAAIFSLLLGTNCNGNKKTSSTAEALDTDQWELIWSDEFDYKGLPDSTRWSFDVDGNDWYWGNNEAQWYTSKEQRNAYVDNGVLTITAIKEDINERKYTSARLRSLGKGDWKYAKIEVRAKAPKGKGTWAAIWMMPSEDVYGTWPRSGEIDIMEYVGHNPDSVFSTVHTERFNHIIHTQVGETTVLPKNESGFHVYSLEWEENELRSYVDGKLYFTFSNDGSGHTAWPFDQKFHLLINLAIGGGLGGKEGIDDSLFPHVYEIDYVRVYKKVQ